jgi:thioredoxin-dependent peroxiredoxin
MEKKMSEDNHMGKPLEAGMTLPEVVLPIRVGGEFINLNTKEQFADKRVILFGLPGAFTPTCSEQQLPGFESKFAEFQEKGIDEIYCLSVNDSFVMNSWFNSLGIKNVRPLPDGNGEFTNKIGAECKKSNVGFGMRSWRYAVVANNGVVESVYIEEGYQDNSETDPYEISTPENVLENL